VKVPILLLIAFLLGWLPTWLIMRARLWGMQRRIEAFDRQRTMERTQEAMAEETQSPVI
jgi:lipopolysaccharide assembly protein A